MAKKSDYSLFINFFFNSLKKIGLFIIFRPSIFTIHYFFDSLFTINYKKGHYLLIIIPYPDPLIYKIWKKLILYKIIKQNKRANFWFTNKQIFKFEVQKYNLLWYRLTVQSRCQKMVLFFYFFFSLNWEISP